MTYVYMLSDHDEYGAEHVVATLDRAKLPALLAAGWPPPRPALRTLGDEEAEGLRLLLEQPDEELAKGTTGAHGDTGARVHKLSESTWNGPQLHVVELK